MLRRRAILASLFLMWMPLADMASACYVFTGDVPGTGIFNVRVSNFVRPSSVAYQAGEFDNYFTSKVSFYEFRLNIEAGTRLLPEGGVFSYDASVQKVDKGALADIFGDKIAAALIEQSKVKSAYLSIREINQLMPEERAVWPGSIVTEKAGPVINTDRFDESLAAVPVTMMDVKRETYVVMSAALGQPLYPAEIIYACKRLKTLEENRGIDAALYKVSPTLNAGEFFLFRFDPTSVNNRALCAQLTH